VDRIDRRFSTLAAFDETYFGDLYQIFRKEGRQGISSYDLEKLKKNDDGSVTVYFRLEAPKGLGTPHSIFEPERRVSDPSWPAASAPPNCCRPERAILGRMQRRGWKNFWTFSILSVLLLGLVPALSAGFGTSMDFGALADRASKATGVPWTSNLWDVTRLAIAEPGLWVMLVGSAVPTLAALSLLAVGRDRTEWRVFAGRWRPVGLSGKPLGSDLTSYALLIGGVLLCLLVSFWIRDWIAPGEFVQPQGLWSWSLLSTVAFAALLDQGAVLEEGGWRGYAHPLLQDLLLDPVRTAVVIGVVWSLWHVPRDVMTGVIDRLGLVTYLLLYLPSFTLGTVTVSIVAAWFMNRLGGSVIPAIMVHGLTNDAVGFSGVTVIERALTPDAQLTRAIPTLVFALMLILVGWRQQGRSLQPREPEQLADS
jgi:hypothetical protein